MADPLSTRMKISINVDEDLYCRLYVKAANAPNAANAVIQ
jgi:hypothetical protein